MAKDSLVSIIIPTFNAQKTIESCLKSIRKQTYSNIEIIVVDNHSKDRTLEKARKLADKLYSRGPERSAQRNFGIQKSKGEYIAWFDADMELSPRVIEECVEKVQNEPAVKAVIIPEKSVGQGFWAKCRALEKRCYLRDEQIEAIRFIEKQTFNKVGRMSPDFISGEDWDITIRVRKQGFRIGRIKNFVIHNEGHLKLVDDLRKKYYYATKSLPYVNRHIKSPKDVFFFIFRPAFFRNWKILLSDPMHAIGLFFMKIAEFTVGFLGVLRARLRN